MGFTCYRNFLYFDNYGKLDIVKSGIKEIIISEWKKYNYRKETWLRFIIDGSIYTINEDKTYIEINPNDRIFFNLGEAIEFWKVSIEKIIDKNTKEVERREKELRQNLKQHPIFDLELEIGEYFYAYVSFLSRSGSDSFSDSVFLNPYSEIKPVSIDLDPSLVLYNGAVRCRLYDKNMRMVNISKLVIGEHGEIVNPPIFKTLSDSIDYWNSEIIKSIDKTRSNLEEEVEKLKKIKHGYDR